ncbi:hypothetical protein C0989_010883, partial [Termitomyces sp. Mn162]
MQPNILIDNSGRARLADFGLSGMSDPQILAWTSTSSAGSRGGSVRWQAPELFDVKNDVYVKNTPESDVYAWSCVCYEIFTGTVPFADLQRESTIELNIMSGARPARPLEFSQPWNQWGLTTTIWTLMEECWIQNPENRPKTSQVIARLESEQGINPQSIDETNDPFPACFRQRMRHPMDPSDAYAILNRIHDPKSSDVVGIQSDLSIPELPTQKLHPVEPSASDQGSIPASSHWHQPDEAETRKLLEDIVIPIFQTVNSDDPVGIMIHDLQD